MYFNLNIVFIFLSYQCLTVYTFQIPNEILDGFEENRGPHCSLPAPIVDKHKMPIPYAPNITGAALIEPDQNGNLYVNFEERFQLSCSRKRFVSPTVCKGLFEITVKCLGGNILSYKSRKYKFDIFRCDAIPKPKLEPAEKNCSGIENGVMDVMFRTRIPLMAYRLCYDAAVKNTLYAWNYVNTPIYKFTQTSKMIPQFIKTGHYDGIDVLAAYDSQKETIMNIISNTKLRSERIINKEIGLFLVPAHLLSKNEFFYVFQQHATYFYENTVPQWSVFNKGVWRDVNRLFVRNLAKSTGKHLVVSGSFNSSFLVDPTIYATSPLVLSLPNIIPVPEYVWKMDYDLKKKVGTVFIGLNNPHKLMDSSGHFCKVIPCPGKLGRKASGKDLVFCCSKESFEKVYGPIDPIVFEEYY